MMREPRPPRLTDRQKRADDYRALWHKNRRRSPRPGRTDRIRGGEVARALQTAADCTGDPRFNHALVALRHYGLDHEFRRSAARVDIESFGDLDGGHIRQIEFLHRRRGFSVREACERIVAEHGLGHEFDSEVERLRQKALTRFSG